MASKYCLELPFPPTVNSYYVKTRRSVRISERGQRFRVEVIHSVSEQTGALKLSSRLSVRVDLHPPDKRVRDVDNYCKSLFDALTLAEFWVDDRQVKKMTVIMHEYNPNKRGLVHLRAKLRADNRQ